MRQDALSASKCTSGRRIYKRDQIDAVRHRDCVSYGESYRPSHEREWRYSKKNGESND